MKPCFAARAHLAALFPQEVQEKAQEESLQQGKGLDQEVADERMDPPSARVACIPPEDDDELLELSFPRQLSNAMDEALQEELTQGNRQRHDWIERLGEPEREVRRGHYRRMADFWVSTTDPDATMMNCKGEGTRLGYHTHYVVDGERRAPS